MRHLEVERTKLSFDHPGPWLLLDVWVYSGGERRFALWRETGAVYPVDPEHGEVGLDPIVPPIRETRPTPILKAKNSIHDR